MQNTLTFSLIFLAQFATAQLAPIDSIYLNWETVTPPPQGTFDDYAEQANTLYATSEDGVFQSTDFGINWQLHPTLPAVHAEYIYADESLILVSFLQEDDDNYEVYRSTDGGATFTLVMTEWAPNGDAGWGGYGPYISDFKRINDQSIYLQIGGEYNFNNINLIDIFHSADNGSTWSNISDTLGLTSTLNFAVSGDTIAYLGKDEIGYALNPDLSDLTTDDQFFTTKRNATFYYNGIFDIYEYANQRRLRTLDFGATWDTLHFNFSQLNSVEMIDNQVYIATHDGLFRSFDADFNEFEPIFTGNEAPAVCYQVYDLPSGMYMKGYDKILSRSTNAGLDWTILHYGVADAPLWSLKNTGNRLWAIGTKGQLHSTDNPPDWTLSPSHNLYSFDPDNTNPSFNGFNHLVEIGDTLLIAKNDGVIYRSTDYGIQWDTAVAHQSTTWYESVRDGEHVYFVGSHVLHTEDAGLHWDTITTVSLGGQSYLFRGDTIFTATSQSISRSFNHGNSWEIFPASDMKPYKLGWQNDTLINISKKGAVYISTDFGDNWIQTGFESSIIQSWQNLNSGGFFDGLIYIIGQGNLAFSTNYGQNWGLITDDFEYYWFYPFAVYNQQLYTRTDALKRLPLTQLTDQLNAINGDGGVFSGTIFKDVNDNCEQDANETGIADKIVKFTPGPYYTVTNAQGDYNIALPSGYYDLTIEQEAYHTSICTDTIAENLVLLQGETTDTNFVFTPLPGFFDVEISLSPMTAARPGFIAQYKLKVKNVGTETAENPVIQFAFPNQSMLFLNSNLNSSLDGNLLTITLNDLPIEQSADIFLSFEIFATTPIETQLVFNAQTVEIDNDETPENNVANLQQTVTGSFDPNDKVVMPEGDIFALQSEFDYLIRFQNTGNDTAFTVRITDTLSHFLDPFSLKTLDASHEYETEITSTGIVTWTFNNILLPDSTTNEPASHGFIRFEITPKDTLDIGESIDNSAAIYFDFNEPIITNEVQNLVVKEPFYAYDFVEICSGDIFAGIPYFENSILQDTVNFELSDSIYITEITVLLTHEMTIDTALAVGDSYLDIAIFSDTMIVQNLQNQYACDSIVTTNIDLINSNSTVFSDEFYFKVAPNPVTDILKLDLLVPDEDGFSIKIMDATNRIVETQQCHVSNRHTVHFNTEHWAGGVYYILLEKSDGIAVRKVVKL